MSHKQPTPRPKDLQEWPFSWPRPPKPDESTEEYCRKCDCVRVGNQVFPRRYVEWLRDRPAPLPIAPPPPPDEIIHRGGIAGPEFILAVVAILLLFAVYAICP